MSKKRKVSEHFYNHVMCRSVSSIKFHDLEYIIYTPESPFKSFKLYSMVSGGLLRKNYSLTKLLKHFSNAGENANEYLTYGSGRKIFD